MDEGNFGLRRSFTTLFVINIETLVINTKIMDWCVEQKSPFYEPVDIPFELEMCSHGENH